MNKRFLQLKLNDLEMMRDAVKYSLYKFHSVDSELMTDLDATPEWLNSFKSLQVLEDHLDKMIDRIKEQLPESSSI